jgi:DegV family protein with EDD domain
MKNIAIVTDSTNDIPLEMLEKYHIYVVPLTIVWGDQQFLDGIELTAEKFYDRLSTDSVRPTTSQPAPSDFLSTYEQAVQDGAEEIIVITISSAMSGTIQSARTAAENFRVPIHILDSKTNSMSLGWQVLSAARARDAGADTQEILALVNEVRIKQHFHIALETIEYLMHGGRIAGAARLISGLLHIKPEIKVNHESGSVEAVGISHTRKISIDRLFANFFKNLDTTHPLHIAVLHNAALDEAQALARRIEAEFHPSELIIAIVSPVLGVHTGPKALGIAGFNE